MEEQVSGTIEHIVYRNADNGYTVFTLLQEGKELTCVGFFADVSEGSSLEATGRYTEHASYGRQFKVEKYTFRAPETREVIEIYLGSGAVKGIGRALAARIVKRFGDDALRILEEEPERLAEVKGISPAKARAVGEEAALQAGMRHAMIFLEGLGISLKMGIRIYKEYGEEVYGILKENPYRLAEDIDGIGFLTADRLAAKAGITETSPYRIRSGILYILGLAAMEGNVYLPEDQLLSRCSDTLQVDEELIRDELGELAMEHRVTMKLRTVQPLEGSDPGSVAPERIVYISSYYYMELGAARKLLDLSRPLGISPEEAAAKAEQLAKNTGIRLEDAQLEAVVRAAVNGVFILTGGPGTGKTTTINAMIRYFRAEGCSVVLAAPTGRAARRMSETTGYEASTVHRLLEISSSVDDEMSEIRFERNEEHPLDADVIIIDELSMVDLFLFHALLSATAVGTRLILVGDVNQLPSVGPGCVLRDLLESGAFPSVTLTRIFRQAASSDIVVNAHRINSGEQISLDNHSRDFFFLKRSDPNLIISNMIELIRDKLPGYVHAKPWDIQVLAPMKKGVLGVDRLNVILQQYLNPQDGKKAEKQYGDRTFRVGDKVMQMRNNYQLGWEIRGKHGIIREEGSGIFNGDLGIIRSIDEYAKYIGIEFDENRMVDYPFSELDDLELAYAATIHKSQGSEYPAVILPLLGGPRMLLTRNLLYTAVTRARSCVVVLGNENTVRDMIRNETELRRYTTLDERILELCGSKMPEA